MPLASSTNFLSRNLAHDNRVSGGTIDYVSDWESDESETLMKTGATTKGYGLLWSDSQYLTKNGEALNIFSSSVNVSAGETRIGTAGNYVNVTGSETRMLGQKLDVQTTETKIKSSGTTDIESAGLMTIKSNTELKLTGTTVSISDTELRLLGKIFPTYPTGTTERKYLTYNYEGDGSDQTLGLGWHTLEYTRIDSGDESSNASIIKFKSLDFGEDETLVSLLVNDSDDKVQFKTFGGYTLLAHSSADDIPCLTINAKKAIGDSDSFDFVEKGQTWTNLSESHIISNTESIQNKFITNI